MADSHGRMIERGNLRIKIDCLFPAWPAYRQAGGRQVYSFFWTSKRKEGAL